MKLNLNFDKYKGITRLRDWWKAVKAHFTQVQEAHNALEDTVAAESEKLSIEITQRTNADTALGQRITTEENTRSNADTALGQRITAEADARMDADSDLQGDVNTIRSDIVIMENRLNGKADRVHKHTIEDITDFPQTMTPTDGSVTVEKLSESTVEFIKSQSGHVFTEKPIYKGEIYPVIANQSFSLDNYHQCDDADGVFQGYAFDMSADVTVYIGDIKYSASKTDEVIVNTSGAVDEAEYYVWLKKYDNGNTEFVLGDFNEIPINDGYVMLPCGHIHAKANADGEWSYYDVGLGYEAAVDGEEHLTTSTDLNYLRKEISALQNEIALFKEQIKGISGGGANITIATPEMVDEMVDNATPDIYVPGGTQIGIASDEAVEAIFNEG